MLQGVRDAVAGVLNAVEALFDHFYEWKKGQGTAATQRNATQRNATQRNARLTVSRAVDAESAQLTAKVGEKCVAVEKVPLDNNTVACNAIRNWMGAIKGIAHTTHTRHTHDTHTTHTTSRSPTLC